MKLIRLLVLVTAPWLAAQCWADDASDPWIALARSYLGGEDALNAVQSLHFEGSFAAAEPVPDPANPQRTIEQPARVHIDIVFQQPMQQRQILRSDKVERTTSLDNYDAWERVVDLANNGRSRVVLLDGIGIRRLRATTVENLSFYTALRGSGRTTSYLGEVAVDGVACAKVAFTHAGNIVFTRFFDKATGRLVKTEVQGGGEIREEGELTVNGIRFPRKVINHSAGGASTAIDFERVTVNEVFPPETFAVPPTLGR